MVCEPDEYLVVLVLVLTRPVVISALDVLRAVWDQGLELIARFGKRRHVAHDACIEHWDLRS